MALNSALHSILESTSQVNATDLVLINHFDIVNQDQSVNLDVSIPSLGINLTYNMSKEDYEENMKNGFNAVSLFIVKDLANTLQNLADNLQETTKVSK